MPLRPLQPPYDPDLAAALERWMPPGSEHEPLALFRVLARHRDLFDRMRPLGAGLLGHGRLPMRTRELLILRTTARAGAGYEWGVHVTAFAGDADLTPAETRATVLGGPDDELWRDPADRTALRVADELHEHGRISDTLWPEVDAHFPADVVLEMVICCGWYRLLATVILSAGLDAEPWAEAFPGPVRNASTRTRAGADRPTG